MFRGNRSFGGAGEHGECQMPPWPSTFAGAFRAAMLAKDAKVLAEFGQKKPQGRLGEVLGTPADPGSFELAWASLAIRTGGTWKPALPVPADLACCAQDQKDNGQSASQDGVKIRFLSPSEKPSSVRTSYHLPLLPILRQTEQTKSAGGLWLAGDNLDLYLRGELPGVIRSDSLYCKEVRVGIALDSRSGTAAEGAIYSTEAISFKSNAGFLVGINGLGEDADVLLPGKGLLRLGGDGRAAEYERISSSPTSDLPLDEIEHARRFRLLLTAPSIFPDGWLPPGVQKQGNTYRLEVPGFSARLASAAVPRHMVISGWDIANWQPKAARRAVPSGSVYWFDESTGDPAGLAAWVANGIWSNPPDKQRQAEGFNRGLIAAWRED